MPKTWHWHVDDVVLKKIFGSERAAKAQSVYDDNITIQFKQGTVSVTGITSAVGRWSALIGDRSSSPRPTDRRL